METGTFRWLVSVRLFNLYLGRHFRLCAPLAARRTEGQGSEVSTMSRSLTIRNMTAVPICLSHVGFYAAGDAALKETRRVDDGDASDLPDDDEKQTQTPESLAIHMDPLQSKLADTFQASGSPKGTLTCTIEVAAQLYSVTISAARNGSSRFTSTASNAKFDFTGVFFHADMFLSIYTSVSPNDWMLTHSDDVPLSLLSIPGTHNSPTCYRALPSVRCQAVPVRVQLNNGIRFLDIRMQPEHHENLEKDRLILVHGAFPISFKGGKCFRDVVGEIEAFLDANPSETVVISLKREGTGKATDEHLSRILHRHYANDSNRWWTEPRIPKLGEARGKIVLLRRFRLHEDLKSMHDGCGWGLDAENWGDNTMNDTNGDVCVQDFYQVLETRNIDAKIKCTKEHLDRSCILQCRTLCDDDGSACPPPLYLNFLSASNFWRVSCWPDRIAAKLNPALIRYLCIEHATQSKLEDGIGSTGIMIMDMVGNKGDWDIVRCVIGMNAKLLMAEKRDRLVFDSD